MNGSRLLALLVLTSGLSGVGAAVRASPLGGHGRPPATVDSPVGAGIYLQGVLGSGQPLVGERQAAESLTGPQAACANCHRRSGLGGQEGRSVIPPVTGRFLFHPRAGSFDEIDLPYVPGARPDREPYTDATLARAIREGIDSAGHPMSLLMPHYALTDADLAGVIVHLRSLDRRVPGVTDTTLHFATIITPDADPAARGAMLEVLNRFIEDRNNTQRLPASQNMMSPGIGFRAKGMFKVTRRWELHVWEPTGPKSTWASQLEKDFATQPVFAAISGLGGADWTPVQEFCEKAALPCLFPNVELPPAGTEDEFYTMYFSRGVRLEADLIGRQLTGGGSSSMDGLPATTQVRQVYRQGDVGEAAAAALAATLRSDGIRVSDRAVPATASPSAVAAEVRDLPADGALVLWLRAPDLAAIPKVGGRAVYLSEVMGDVDSHPPPAVWRKQAHIAYPFDLPERRRVRLDYPFGWFRIRGIALVAPHVQADTYLACGLLAETIKHMVDTFVPEYLVERLEDTAEHRIITGYYPRLTLGPHQRFASKGGYMVHVDPDGRGLVPEGDWGAP